MNDKNLEALSALMDGETSEADAATLHALSRDEGLRATWARYHLISDCMRGTLPRYVDPALANRISVALRNEPSIIAARDSGGRQAWKKPLAGMAIAASVATLAVVGIQMNRSGSADVQVAARPPATNSASGGQFNLASGQAGRQPVRSAVPASTLDPRMNRYLINYNEQRTNDAVQGMSPYVRIIADDQDKNP